MEKFLIYDFKVALLLSAFLCFYMLLMRKETWFALRRTFLLLSASLSLTLPFCVLTFHKEETIVMSQFPNDIIPSTSEVAENGWSSVSILYTIAGTIILAGAALILAKLIADLFKLRKLLRKSEKRHMQNGTVLAISNEDIRPFSFFHYVVISTVESKEISPALLAHEYEHIRRFHTIDLIFAELYLILQWFNPMAWLLRKELKLVHEFEADSYAMHQSGACGTYMRLLMRKASSNHHFSLVNTFSHKGFLRRRFMMMSSSPSSKKSRLKVLCILPVVAVSLMATAETITDYTYVTKHHKEKPSTQMKRKVNQKIKKAHIENQPERNSKEKQKSSMYVYVDSMPVSQELLDTLPPDQIRSITIVKDTTENVTSPLSSQKQTSIYVEIKDTVLKKIDDDVFMMTKMQTELTNVEKEVQNVKEKALAERIKAEKTKKEAIIKAVEQRRKAEQAKKEEIKKAVEEKIKAGLIKKEVKENITPNFRESAFILTDRKDTTLCLSVDSDSIVNGFNAYWIDTREGKNLIVIKADTDSVRKNRIAMVFMQS